MHSRGPALQFHIGNSAFKVLYRSTSAENVLAEAQSSQRKARPFSLTLRPVCVLRENAFDFGFILLV
jgi:hypothetical protein